MANNITTLSVDDFIASLSREETSSKKITSPGMTKSLTDLYHLLQCPLCHLLLKEPATLTQCTHYFCIKCIEKYTENNWNCPECNAPVANTGRGHSYRKKNPPLQTMVDSLTTMCEALQKAPEEWWKCVQSEDEEEDYYF